MMYCWKKDLRSFRQLQFCINLLGFDYRVRGHGILQEGISGGEHLRG